jgi:hypothetical protein
MIVEALTAERQHARHRRHRPTAGRFRRVRYSAAEKAAMALDARAVRSRDVVPQTFAVPALP